MWISSRTFRWVLVALLSCFLSHVPAQAKIETWRQENAGAFAKGRRHRVVISDEGRVQLGRELHSLGTLDAARVWDLLALPNGAIYAATGDAGKVFRLDAANKDKAAWSVVLDAKDTQALSLCSTSDGTVFVGTGPSGEVIDVTDPKHPSSRPDPKVQYIWDLASDAAGNLYAATGPSGQLWKRSKAGKWSLLFDSRHTHLLCVAVAADGTVYAGSDGEGVIYRVSAAGKPSVVYDAPQSEVRTLLLAADGNLYAGTAADSSGGGGSRSMPSFAMSDDPRMSSNDPSRRNMAASSFADPPVRSGPRPGGGSTAPPGGTATPKPASPGENAVYRIGPDGVAREIFRGRVLIHALAMARDRLYVGTGSEGQVFEIHLAEGESVPVAKLDAGQVLALQTDREGNVIVGSAEPGGVSRLDSALVHEGTLTSEVHDAKLASKLGALTWRADLPEGSSIAFQIRTGNVGEPDSTWSDWSAELSDPAGSFAKVPPGRFAQYRATLRTRDPKVGPELRSVALMHQSANLAPEINKVEVPDVTTGDGSLKRDKLTIRWEASDPNGDELRYTLHLRKEGWPEWVAIGTAPITDTSYQLDAISVPDGIYRVKITASDRASNNADDALSRDRVSDSFVVDHDAPRVQIQARPKEKGAVITLIDAQTRIAKASYSLDSGEWTPIFPDDGLFDTGTETITLKLPDVKPGAHVIMIRAHDAAGNVGTGDLLLDIR